MRYKSLREEWPYENEKVWLRWTTDGVNYVEKVVHEKNIADIEALGVPEWRIIEPPEWMSESEKQHFLERNPGLFE